MGQMGKAGGGGGGGRLRVTFGYPLKLKSMNSLSQTSEGRLTTGHEILRPPLSASAIRKIYISKDVQQDPITPCCSSINMKSANENSHYADYSLNYSRFTNLWKNKVILEVYISQGLARPDVSLCLPSVSLVCN